MRGGHVEQTHELVGSDSGIRAQEEKVRSPVALRPGDAEIHAAAETDVGRRQHELPALAFGEHRHSGPFGPRR